MPIRFRREFVRTRGPDNHLFSQTNPSLFSGLVCGGIHAAEAQVVVPVAWVVPVAVSGSRVPSVVVPTAATDDAVRA